MLLATGFVNEKPSEVPASQLTEPPVRGIVVPVHEPPDGVSETSVVPVASLPSPEEAKITVY
jgi:hypothetical protein